MRGETTAAREREARVLESARVGLWEVDADGRVTFVSEAAAAMLGYSSDALVGRALTDLMDRDSAVVMRLRLERRRLGLRDVWRARVRHRDGSDVWVIVSAAPSFDSDGSYAGARAAVIDVTAHKELRALAPGPGRVPDPGGAPAATWTLHVESGMLEWSREVYALFEVTPDTFTPSYANALALVHPHDRHLVQRSIEATLVDGKPFSAYFRVVADSGIRVLHAHAELSSSGAEAYLRGVVRDVTGVAARRSITPREREVLDLLAKGMTGGEIARRLQISAETVRTHIQNAMAKLNADNRVHAVALAIAGGEIDV